ncbi:hypothetical protein BHM03_00034740, partial [Ensete ventricosum]
SNQKGIKSPHIAFCSSSSSLLRPRKEERERERERSRGLWFAILGASFPAEEISEEMAEIPRASLGLVTILVLALAILMPAVQAQAPAPAPTSDGANVIEASEEEEFAYCKQTNVEDVQFVGPTILELTKAGVHYFYCSVGLHCEGGQKLRVNVTDGAAA